MEVNNFIDKKFFSSKNKKKDLKNLIKKIKNHKTNIFKYFDKDYKILENKIFFSKFKKFQKIVIIGMGGSILGSKSIYSFLRHRIKKEFFFIDNLDDNYLKNFSKRKDLKKFLFIIISKSGNTLETITILNCQKSGIIDKNNTIIITENKKSYLHSFAKRRKIALVNHDMTIGGRYSVLSEVGMLPAYLMGLNIKNFRKRIFKKIFKEKINAFEKIIPILTDIYSKKKLNSIILINYCPELNDFLYWCQQLLAESLGKKNIGLVPIVSQAPKDHHSLLQLYLDGPRDKLFYIFSLKASKKKIFKKNLSNSDMNFLKGKSVGQVVESQKKAFVQILKKKKFPLREFKISKINEETFGELASYFMLETWMLGDNLNINPFNQPAVEQVKVLTNQPI